MRIGIVVALDAEARTLPASSGVFAGRHQYEVMLAGPGPRRAEHAARRLLAQGCDALLSFGLAGGLAPALRPGALVNASKVCTANGQMLSCADPLRLLLRDALSDITVHDAPLYGADAPLVTSVDKSVLHAARGTVAVDMESAAIGRVAGEHDAPFAVLRCVVDPCDFTLPRAALVGMADDGGNRPMATAVAVLTRPWELPNLIRLALWYGDALRALRSAGALLCSQVR